MSRVKHEAEPLETLPKYTTPIDPEAREAQLISLAMDLVEERLRNGTATSQETVHFLKLGSMRERDEREKLKRENVLLKAKTEALQAGSKLEDLYNNAIEAMKRYHGDGGEDVRHY